jgi:hypothetical protein
VGEVRRARRVILAIVVGGLAGGAIVACDATQPTTATDPPSATVTGSPAGSADAARASAPAPASTVAASAQAPWTPGFVEVSTVVPIGANAFGADSVRLEPGCDLRATTGAIATVPPPCRGDVRAADLPVLNAPPGAVVVVATENPFSGPVDPAAPIVTCGQIDPATLRFMPDRRCGLGTVPDSPNAFTLPPTPNIWVIAVRGCVSPGSGIQACGTWHVIVDTASAGWTPLPSSVWALSTASP